MRLILILLLLPMLSLSGAEPKSKTARGDRLLWSYLEDQVRRIEKDPFEEIRSKDQWQRKRPELRRQFFDMVGLWPLPKKTDLKPTITGRLEEEKFIVEKLHYQSIPGLYVTANLYLPKNQKGPFPTILYVCGHGASRIGKISYGNKVTYQHHGRWFAENGYVCMIVDTLQLGEIAGLHHGTYSHSMWWWHCRGYTPAGIECWNGIRALDYLETRKEVDPKRFGVTGRSGGGATSWWIAAADDRPQCIIPVAGIADLRAHVLEGQTDRLRRGVIAGHCDCMYMVNTYEWDFTTVMALCAPRPLMLGNSDKDSIFPVPGYRRMAKKVRKLYDLYGAKEKFTLLETKGPHKDTPELRKGAFEWMNQWLKNDTSEVEVPELPRFKPQELKVLERLPGDSINADVQLTFVKAAKPKLPAPKKTTKEWWKAQNQKWHQALKDHVFRGWTDNPPPLNLKQFADATVEGIRLRGWSFDSEEKVTLDLWLLAPAKLDKPSEILVVPVDELGWREWEAQMMPDFQQAILGVDLPAGKEQRARAVQKLLSEKKWAIAILAPRGIGPTRWATKNAQGRSIDQHIKRRFALIGETVDGQRVWDVRRGVQALQQIDGMKAVPVRLQAHGTMAGIALYTGLFEPLVRALDLSEPPSSHHRGPIFLNVRRHFDMPQAVAMALPRQMRLFVNDKGEWQYPLTLQKRLGLNVLKVESLPKQN